MSYKIKTDNAAQKLATMISCVENGKDPGEKDIDTWGIKSYNDKKYFIHTRDQWDKKCCLYGEVLANGKNDTIAVSFRYLTTCKQEDRTEYDKGIVLGRFTELLINHFADLQINIEIKP